RYRQPVLALTAAFGGYALARGDTFWPLKARGAGAPPRRRKQRAEGSGQKAAGRIRGLPTAFCLLPSALGAVAASGLALLFVIVSLPLVLPGLGKAIQA